MKTYTDTVRDNVTTGKYTFKTWHEKLKLSRWNNSAAKSNYEG